MKIVERQPGPLQQCLPLLRLYGGQAQTLVRIMANQKLHHTIAQFADAIEQHDTFIGFQIRGGGSRRHGIHLFRKNSPGAPGNMNAPPVEGPARRSG
ncbi:Unknown protein sequence [Pseudomonas syringae pv. maculicola]|nr:Unknown protein sequence [Pseudomonas savastanoi pv. phaseolicola]KPB80029.1 Unknown protein sequence [Pseudomonas syringae pv. maculicola]